MMNVLDDLEKHPHLYPDQRKMNSTYKLTYKIWTKRENRGERPCKNESQQEKMEGVGWVKMQCIGQVSFKTNFRRI